MTRRPLGDQGLTAPVIGLGCMGLSWAYGKADTSITLAVLHRSLELGAVLWDTADIYGEGGANERLLAGPLKLYRDQVVLASKAGIVARHSDRLEVNGRPEYLQECCKASLKRLGVDSLDLFYLHRVDPQVPIEESVGAMGELIDQGYVRYLGLSEASAETVRRAHRERPISAVQSEYSLFTRDLEREILPTLRELKIGLVAFSPLGRGLLTGAISRETVFEPDDSRRNLPRFQDRNLEKNLALVARVKEVAKNRGAFPSQVALAWLLHQGSDIVPIPGTKRVQYLERNVEAARLRLSPDDLAALAQVSSEVAGDRYPPELLKAVDL